MGSVSRAEASSTIRRGSMVDIRGTLRRISGPGPSAARTARSKWQKLIRMIVEVDVSCYTKYKQTSSAAKIS